MKNLKKREISIYEAESALFSFFRQGFYGFMGVILMLLLTGGNPSGLIVVLTFACGMGWVAWKEKQRLNRLRIKALQQTKGDVKPSPLLIRNVSFNRNINHSYH